MAESVAHGRISSAPLSRFSSARCAIFFWNFEKSQRPVSRHTLEVIVQLGMPGFIHCNWCFKTSRRWSSSTTSPMLDKKSAFSQFLLFSSIHNSRRRVLVICCVFRALRRTPCHGGRAALNPRTPPVGPPGLSHRVTYSPPRSGVAAGNRCNGTPYARTVAIHGDVFTVKL